MIRAVIFDCFGVLIVDALDALAAPFLASDPTFGERLRAVQYAADRGIITADETTVELATLLHLNTDALQQSIREGEVKNTAVMEFAGSLRPRYKTAVLSNISNGGLARRFAPGELERYFDQAISSGDIGFAKPEAQAYATAAERLEVRLEECVMIDDRQDYCDGAVAVGMQAIRFQMLEQLERELKPLLAPTA